MGGIVECWMNSPWEVQNGVANHDPGCFQIMSNLALNVTVVHIKIRCQNATGLCGQRCGGRDESTIRKTKTTGRPELR